MKLRRGFTLVELMVSIGIIMLLAGIVFAASGPVRENARQSRCISNMHQIGVALRMYIDDYNGSEPALGQAADCTELGLPSLENFDAFTRSYVKNRAVLFCPSYHGIRPEVQLTSSYSWNPERGIQKPTPYQWREVVKRRGADAPVLTCDQHNAVWDISTEPRWTLKKVIVLRLNGQVQVRNVPVRQFFPSW